jgi:hypothetical protein
MILALVGAVKNIKLVVVRPSALKIPKQDSKTVT